MSDGEGFHAMARSVLRERALDAAAEIICDDGWQGVTMSRVAERVGVSRNLVYKELGSKDALAEAVIGRHAERFLEGVAERLRASDDLVSGLAAATEYTLRTAADDRLLKAVLRGAQGVTDSLLPLMTTRPEPVLRRAQLAVLAEAGARHGGALPEAELATLVDVVVRVTLSHLTQPTGPIERAVDEVRWIVGRAVG